LQTELDEEQKKALDAVAKTLKATPEMGIEFLKIYNIPRESDQLALQEGKKSFLFFNRRISSDEDISSDEQKLVDALHQKDSAFNAYVDNRLQTRNSLLSIFDKSKTLVGSHKLERKLENIFQQRANAVAKYLTETAGVPLKRFRIVDPKEKGEVPYASFSRLKTDFFLTDEQEQVPDEVTAKK
jgi:hypothetical protein